MVIAGSTPPKKVKHAPRLKDDLESLKELLFVVKLSVSYVRAASIQTIVYGFWDASRSTFGVTFHTERGILYQKRVWGKHAFRFFQFQGAGQSGRFSRKRNER
jgi:hypothetical protein